MMQNLRVIRAKIRQLHCADEVSLIQDMVKEYGLEPDKRKHIEKQAAALVSAIRIEQKPSLMESFLAEYGLTTEEGIALMCLAEALLRVPDTKTTNELIEDKVANSSWYKHLGKSESNLVNASTRALMISGKVLKNGDKKGIGGTIHRLVKKLGRPVIRLGATMAMKEMAHQFVLGRTIDEAMKRGRVSEKKGYKYSYDMLGEAALTEKDADTFFKSYVNAIQSIKFNATHDEVEDNPGISIKLSALHPRYELNQRDRIITELVDRVKELVLLAKDANIGLNIDAEEADRLDLSLDIIETVLRMPELEGWDGFGVVIQAYGKRAAAVIDWLYQLASELDRKVSVRLVKGAYWDTEIKQAQVEGTEDFPVFTRKSATDVFYICCARKLLAMTDRIYPQFATHNAHTVAAILEMTNEKSSFEFQRLHGMGETLYEQILKTNSIRCRIYAPVGAHRELLAYLVRRLLENGANSSFVNQIVDKSINPEMVAHDPFDRLEIDLLSNKSSITMPKDLFLPERINSKGWNLNNQNDLIQYDKERSSYRTHQWHVEPITASPEDNQDAIPVYNPANLDDCIGFISQATEKQIENAVASAQDWNSSDAETRSKVLRKAADLYEEHSGEFFAILAREAGKTPADAIAEIREAVDFLRYYSSQTDESEARGVITCISPWNFPLAIFTGQISAALAAGNGVLAKPAEPTSIVAYLAVQLLHKAGVPRNTLQFLPGKGSKIGAKITSDIKINGVCFTGSTSVAQRINRTMSETTKPDAVFIAETGGINAMVVDSTALPEQAVKDIIASAFQSAGQRCSALRVLYLQKDIAQDYMDLILGAMDELSIGSPWKFSTDIGPVINSSAKKEIEEHIALAQSQGRLIKQLDVPEGGYFVGPAIIQIDDITDLKKEIFGPVLHVATFEADEIDQVIQDINDTGYGLTFGLHSRIDNRVKQITSKVNVGNTYVNRNQIGAIVGSQPFGGEGLSGTGPKAGGPNYVERFKKNLLPNHNVVLGEKADIEKVQRALVTLESPSRTALVTEALPGPTGESNILSVYPRGIILCLGPTREDVLLQEKIAHEMGCPTLSIAPDIIGSDRISGFLERHALTQLTGFDAVALWSSFDDLRTTRRALADRKGPIIPLICNDKMESYCSLERHVCIDTTAAGGNATLLAQVN